MNRDTKEIFVIRRVTSPFLQALPQTLEHFDAYLYAVVKRKPGKDLPDTKWGTDARLDPCELDWASKTISITIPLNINIGITSVDDLDPTFFESVEAAFLSLIQGCMP